MSGKVDVRDRRYPHVSGFRQRSKRLSSLKLCAEGHAKVAEMVIADNVAVKEVVVRRPSVVM